MSTSSITDRALAGEVRSRLSNSHNLDRREIAIGVQNGIVTMKGAVNSSSERAMYEEIVSTIDGVIEIVNELSVAAPTAGF